MSTTLTMNETRHAAVVNASTMATAWQNAFLATGEGGNPALYQTLCVEFFPRGVHLVACDGTMLFRTWVAARGQHTEVERRWPHIDTRPVRGVVVMDANHFALAFIRTLGAATKDFDFAELSLSVEVIDDVIPSEGTAAEPPLGDALAKERLTLRALGQELHCPLLEAPYPDWRHLQFGLDKAELVDGMQLSARAFATVGKLKKVSAVECQFNGNLRQIDFVARGETEVRGLLMPMRRAKDSKAEG